MSQDILLICGSLNQTTMMHQIARQLPEYRCYFTPFYGTALLGALAKAGLLDFSILGGRHRRATEAYLARENLPVDFGGKRRDYDLVITCTDLIVQRNILDKRLILVQEGITEPEGPLFPLVRSRKLPRFLANTAATGLSDAYDLFCVASPGYRDFFIRKGVRPEKIIVTGIPNFDNAAAYLENDFPYRNYVLVATSSIRETGGFDDRPRFIRQARQIAGGRPLIFKLHPNEKHSRALREIRQYAPEALVFADGNVNHMIANCDVLITQYSSVVYVGIALGKEVYSYFDRELLYKLAPIQNGGTSAQRIAEVARQLIRTPLPEKKRLATRPAILRGWQILDA